MSRRRIILGAPTQTGLVEELRLRIGEVGGDFGTGVATQAATSFGTGGVRLLAARDDHKHPYLIAPKSMIQPVSPTTSTAGVTEYFPRGDHVHFVDPGAAIYGAGASNVSLSTSTGGVEAAASRGDHVHYLVPSAAASNVSFAASTAGVASNVSRGDHVHRLLPGALAPAVARVTAHTYVNTGSGPLWVMISHVLGTGGLTSVLDVDGAQAAEVGPTALRPIQIMSVVAPNSEYYFSSTASSVTIKNWAEYQL
jgi:hypothetical protein